MKLYYRVFSQPCCDLNAGIAQQFYQLQEPDFRARTHLFNGRYENLYLDENKIPELKTIIETARLNAAEILQRDVDSLVQGFWLNAMQPGDVTTAHTHDDDDELLSCVYYIDVPENSGDLVIYDENRQAHVLPPKAGYFVFFSPSSLHEVTENRSALPRLSMAFNFGPADQVSS